MSSSPKVSIITAVFNGDLYLEQTIQSVLAQTYSNLEYIVIDGGSTDGTVDIIKQYANQISYWVSEPDKGIYDAWNKGVKAATGEWIAFLGGDDILLPEAVELFVKEIPNEPVDFISSRVEMVDNELVHLFFYGRPWNWSGHKVQMKVSHVGAFHHKSLFSTFGLFDPTYRICGDYEFLLRPGASLRTHFIPKVTAKMRATGISKTDSRAFEEVKRAKVETAHRSVLWCQVEHYYLVAKDKLAGKMRVLRQRSKA